MRNGTAPALRRLMYALEVEYPGVLAYPRGVDLAEVPPGSLAVVGVRPGDAPGLNFQRPALLERHLRVVLFAEGEVAGPFRAGAPDLASWIQQSFEPEPEPPAFAVAGLRRAAGAGRGIGVVWTGGAIEPALAAAGVKLHAEVDGGARYTKLVDAIRAAPPGMFRVSAATDITRLGWALAEAGREGDALVERAEPAPGWWHVHGQALAWPDAALPGPRGAALAALVELEPEVVAALGGFDVEAAIRGACVEDPGAALVSAPEVPFTGSPAAQRADRRRGLGGSIPPYDTSWRVAAFVAGTRMQATTPYDPGFPGTWAPLAGALVRAEAPAWTRAAALALVAGRVDVARVWAERGAVGAASVRALHVLARGLLAVGEHVAARAAIEEALRVADSPALRTTRGAVRLKLAELEGAHADLEMALTGTALSPEDGVATGLGSLAELHARAHSLLARTSREVGDLSRAQAELDAAWATLGDDGAERLSAALVLRDRGQLAQLAGDHASARLDLGRAIERLRALLGWEEHPQLRAARRALALVARDDGHLDEARAELVALLDLERRDAHPTRLAVHLQELADVERRRGGLEAAEGYLREAVTTLRKAQATSYLPTALLRLGEVALARGDDDTARTAWREALELQRSLGKGARSAREVELLEALAGVLKRLGDPAADELGREAYALRKEVGVVSERVDWAEAERRISECEAEAYPDLDLSDLGLREVPAGLLRPPWLESVALGGNPIRSLPPWLFDSECLTALFLGATEVSALPPEIGRLPLRLLFLENSGVQALPEELANCPLETLSLAGLQLTEVPPVIASLSHLSVLDLEDNDLYTLPPWLQTLPLEQLHLRGNPRLHLPAELVKAAQSKATGVQTLLAWYFRSLDRDNTPLNEVKLLLVGRGDVGKTAIRNRLIHDTFKRTRETKGIDIVPWHLPIGEDQITVRVWDFAGQTITHGAHQFFLTERSVYVLVLSGRGDMQKFDAEYWLQLIRAFGTDRDGATSPVLVALNKWEEGPFKLDRNRLREKYPFIVGFVETDCKTGLGVSTLRDALSATIGGLESVRLRFPGPWWKVKERLEAIQRKKHWIPWAEYQAVCTESGEATEDEQATLARVLHTLGIALNYADDPRLHDATVLDPLWVTDRIYRLLRIAVSGELTLQTVQAALPREPAAMRRYLVHLMRRFDLAFPLSDGEDRWLVPQRLPEEQPPLGPEWHVSTTTQVRFVYPILPEGLLPRFITRTWPLSATSTTADGAPLPRWVNGVVLEDNGVRALVRADREDRVVSVIVLGDPAKRPELLAVVRAELAAIHADIPGLNPREEVLVEAGEWMPVQTLRADEARGTSYARTDRGSVSIVPGRELDRLSDPAARLQHRWRARVFVAYSTRDNRLKEELLLRLKPLEVSRGLVSVWHDRCLEPGEPWNRRIQEELAASDVILLLVSAAFLANDYVRTVEIPRALARAEAGEALVVPVVLERCDWQGEAFARYAALPDKARPIRDWRPQSNGVHAVVEGLRPLLEALRERRS